MAHPLLEKAAQHVAQARAIHEEFLNRDMPAEAANQMQAHLAKAAEYRNRVTNEVRLKDTENWLAEPDYKHDMIGGQDIAASLGHGKDFMMESERKDAQMKSFFNFIRRGRDAIDPSVKASLIEDTTGEILVPRDYAGLIEKDIAREGVMRGLATVRPTRSNRVELSSMNITKPTWGKLETDTATYDPADGLGSPPVNANDVIKVWNLNAEVKLGVDELEDSDEDLAEYIRQQLALNFAEVEDDAFAAGTGDANKQPTGIVTGVPAGQEVPAAAGQTLVADDLIKVPYEVPYWARRRGVYLANSGVSLAAQLLKDNTGNYLWQSSVREGQPATFNGYRWYELDGLPAMDTTNDVGAGTDHSVIFGDIARAYLIADRRRMTVQRLVEKYAEDGLVAFLFTHRVGGGTIRPKALGAVLL